MNIYLYTYTHVRIHFQFVELLHHFLREMSFLTDSSIDSSSYVGRRPDSLFGWLGIVLLRLNGKEPLMPQIHGCQNDAKLPNHLFCSVNVSNTESFPGRFFPSDFHKSPRQHTWCFLLSNWHFKWSRAYTKHGCFDIFCLGLVWIAVQKRALTKK